MSQARTAPTADTLDRTDAFQSLDSPNSKLIYLYLGTSGTATPDEICDDLDIPRMTAYSLLDTLVSRGMVAKRDGAYTVSPN